MPRGGFRKHGGRKPKYPGYGNTVAIRVPESLVGAVEDAIADGKLSNDGIGRSDYQKIQEQIHYLLLSWRNKSDKQLKQELGKINRKMCQNLGY